MYDLTTRWVEKKLGSLCSITTGKKDVNEGNPSGEFPFFTCSRNHTWSDGYSFDTEAILIAGNGDVGWLNYYSGKFEAYQRTYVLSGFQASTAYLRHYISGGLRKRLERQHAGSVIQFIKFSDLDDFPVKLPRSDVEQRLIARILDTLDTQIQKTEALITKLEKVKEGLLHDLLTRGIDENGQLRPSPEQAPELYKESPLGLIPKEWSAACLSEISEKITDGTHQAVKTMVTDDTSIPFLYVSCIRNGRVLWDQAAAISRSDFYVISKGREPHRGMILYTAVGSYGHAAAVEKESHFSFQRHISCISPNSKRAKSRFLTYFLNSPRIKRYADQVALGNAQKTVTLGELSGYPITLPSIDEQKEISKELSKIDLKIDTLGRSLIKLKKQKTGLMDDLLTGRVRVTPLLDQAQNTTPA